LEFQVLEQHRRDMLAIDSDWTTAIAVDGNRSAVRSKHDRLAIGARPRAEHVARDPSSARSYLYLADAIIEPQEFTLVYGCCAEHTQKVVYAELQGHGWLDDQGLHVAANRIAIKAIAKKPSLRQARLPPAADGQEISPAGSGFW
jgi:hypothetical protein